MRGNSPRGKKNVKCKMRSNMAIGKIENIKNAQQCAYWKKKMRNAKCAAMWPLEKLKNIQNARQYAQQKKNEKCKMRGNVAIGKIKKYLKCAAMRLSVMYCT